MKDMIKKTLINGEDPDISADSISSFVTLRENGIADCRIIANNDEGKMYLSTLNLGDTVDVNYSLDDGVTYENVFRGTLWEFAPSLTMSGDILHAMAYGYGYPLKIMRVADEYGIQAKTNMFEEEDISDLYYVDNFSVCTLPVDGRVNIVSTWGKYGDDPWLMIDDDDSNYIYGIDIDDTEEYFTFANLPSNWKNLDSIKLWIHLKNHILTGSGNTNQFKVYIDNGTGWTLVATVNLLDSQSSYFWYMVDVTSLLNTATKIDYARLKLVYSGHGSGGGNESQVRITYAHLEVGIGTHGWSTVGSYPWLHYGESDYIWSGSVGATEDYYTFESVPTPAIDERGVIEKLDLKLTAKGDDVLTAYVKCWLWWNDAWHDLGTQLVKGNYWGIVTYPIFPSPYTNIDYDDINTLKLKIVYDTAPVPHNISICAAYLDFSGHLGKKVTLKKMLTDSAKGIIPKYVEKVFGGVSSGHSITTDYIYDYPDEYNFVSLPYESAYDSLLELLRLANAMIAIKDRENQYRTWKGLHWIVTPDNELLIAPIDNHSCSGTRPDIEAKWASRPFMSPIRVREDIFTENIKRESHSCNYVLVAGKYLYPINDAWTEDYSNWNIKYFENGIEVPHPEDIHFLTFHSGLDSTQFMRGNYSIKTHLDTTYIWGTGVFLYRPFNIDLSKLIGIRDYPVIAFNTLRKGGCQKLKVRLYSSETIPSDLDDGDYYEYDLGVGGTETEWTINELVVNPNDMTDDPNKINSWKIVGSPNLSTIKWLLFYWYVPSDWAYDYWIDDICVIGNTIRAAYDSTRINSSTGCRMLTIKNSLAQTDSLNPEDDSTPLALTALYELLRYREDIMSGSLQIPLTPSIKAGQLVWIQSQYDPTFNDYDDTDLSHECGLSNYKVNRFFRILEVEHRFTNVGAFSIIKIHSDLQNSNPVNITDNYTMVMKAINPDFQTKTYASIRTGNDFDVGLTVISKDYPT